MQGTEESLTYFDYMNLAKQEFQHLLERHPELSNLSVREMEVFALLLSDKTQTKIADELYVSYSSVHFHCKNIYRKLNLTSRRQLLITYKDLCSS